MYLPVVDFVIWLYPCDKKGYRDSYKIEMLEDVKSFCNKNLTAGFQTCRLDPLICRYNTPKLKNLDLNSPTQPCC